jgi:hypothetical protein
MKMPRKIALDLQFDLYLITLDGYSPHSFTSANPAEMSDTTSRWQLTVDTIHRCIKAGLMEVWNEGWMKAVGLEDPFALIDALAQHDPFNFEFPRDIGTVYWLHPQLYASDLCQALVAKHDLENIERDFLCEPFIEEIEKLWEINGVGWSSDPLVKLNSTATRDALNAGEILKPKFSE